MLLFILMANESCHDFYYVVQNTLLQINVFSIKFRRFSKIAILQQFKKDQSQNRSNQLLYHFTSKFISIQKLNPLLFQIHASLSIVFP